MEMTAPRAPRFAKEADCFERRLCQMRSKGAFHFLPLPKCLVGMPS